LMRIGTSHFPAADTDAREKAVRQGQRVGADRVIVYPSAGGELVVAYFVRFKLPFGATFRDLRPAEMSELGTGGGVAIGAVIDDSPASRANLLTGDIVLRCDDKAIIDRTDFQSRLRARAGHPVTLTIVRNGETLQRVVRLGPMANAG
jgi:S1-C subfamily serine protease